MNIESEDLEAAVGAGVITQAQVDALRTFVAQRRQSSASSLGSEDEHFRFMRGFNDFFLAIGILLLGSGICFFAGGNWVSNAVAAAVIWGLSEVLVGRMRLVLPGILLSIFFVVFAYLAVPIDFTSLLSPAQMRLFGGDTALDLYARNLMPAVIAAKAPVAAAAAALYYWRFRLPFALLPIAGIAVMVAVALASLAFGPMTPAARSLVILACGIAVFGVAMAFDISDRERITRRADCAFWLHLLAAPLIVHSIVSLLKVDFRSLNGETSVVILLVVAALAVVAVLIDRRAMLVSTLFYVGFIIANALRGMNFQQASTDKTFIFFATLLVLGLFVIALGVGWQPLRRLLMKLISPSLAARLPPVFNSI